MEFRGKALQAGSAGAKVLWQRNQLGRDEAEKAVVWLTPAERKERAATGVSLGIILSMDGTVGRVLCACSC